MYLQELLQNRREHDLFCELLQANGVKSYLEIGSMYGGSLWKVAHALPTGSRVTSIDYPVDTPASKRYLEECIAELNREGYPANVIFGDSAAPETITHAAALAPFDCLFVDGAHTLEAVTADWTNYGWMARMVAFHDISWNATWKSKVPGRVPKPMGVPQLWNELKQRYRHVEFKLQNPCNYYGIGVLWRM